MKSRKLSQVIIQKVNTALKEMIPGNIGQARLSQVSKNLHLIH
jgi:hypothetical protein